MILSGQSIIRRGVILDPQPRIEVGVAGVNRTTYGVGPAGYDLRLDLVERNTSNWFGAPEALNNFWLQPDQFVLASAMEEFRMPDDLLGVVHDKSSWARKGLAVQNTVIEPGWRGFLTLELKNEGREPLLLERGAGICQVIFHLLDEPADHPYNGKYQDQAAGPQVAR
jgi:dCTP deaminase